jgi:hypothetical protein
VTSISREESSPLPKLREPVEPSSASSYYEAIESRSGLRLKEQLRTVLRWIAENPKLPH